MAFVPASSHFLEVVIFRARAYFKWSAVAFVPASSHFLEVVIFRARAYFNGAPLK